MTKKKWSQEVTEHSDALDLDEGVFALEDPAEICARTALAVQISDGVQLRGLSARYLSGFSLSCHLTEFEVVKSGVRVSFRAAI